MRVVSTLFCEKVLKLQSGLSQLIGVFPGRINCLPGPAGSCATMDVQIMIEHDREEAFGIEIRGCAPDGAVVFLLPMQIAFKDPICWVDIALHGLMVPLTVSGRVVIEIHRLGEPWTEAGRLLFDVQPAVAAAPTRLSA
ncbi:hypothetical protein [Bosea sp. RAC05]|uniref:hypothetical protein n=1 Tax=Bosea sp. RAC05 TaxID=1842539 RepID=UPI00083CE0C7|nr:hypothetical protein [Bosea sp. RAC05]AOG03105.1 hypothetical protein BSY19_5270 [Bosea sp. RAC05]